MARPRTSKGMLAAQDKRARAYEMRLRGMSSTAIGEELGISRQRAWELIRDAVAQREEEIREGAETLRATMAEQAERALASLQPGCDAGDPAAHRAAQGWLDRLAKLQGLDLQREQHNGPQVVVIDARAPWERQGDVVDGQVIEGPALEPGSEGTQSP